LIQPNGDLELLKKQVDTWGIIWTSRTSGEGDPPYLLDFKQSNNQLRVCDKHYNVTWQSEVYANKTNNWARGGYAILQEDGNFVVYDGRNRTMWSTGTSGGNKSSSFGTGIIHNGRSQCFVNVLIRKRK